MEELTALLNECSARFAETEEYRMLQSYRIRDNRLSFDERLEIAKCIDRTYAPLFNLMRADVPSLKDSDLLFCALSIQHFETIAIAECLTITPEAVRVRKYRIREKLPSKWFNLLFPEMKRNGNSDVTLQPSVEPIPEIPLPQQSTKNAKVMKEKMSFGKAVTTCFSKYLTLNGRARRSEYWYFYLFTALIALFFYLLKAIFEVSAYPLFEESTIGILKITFKSLDWVLNIGLFIPTFTCAVRRLHDMDDNGWLACLLELFPTVILYIGQIIMDMNGGSIIDPDEIPTLSPNEAVGILAPWLLCMLFLIGIIIVKIVLFSRPGTEGPNSYGPDPIKIITTESK
ncbi:MAG: DUF805 domain-containing protein [Bacteroidaceae bacterium]|nr:DUF805 domain-containing protein [Bacteroidaceae bacterium]